MKILCLADLHLIPNSSWQYADKSKWIRRVFADTTPDVVLIAGDVFESNMKFNPFNLLGSIFKNTPVVFCLGNHEFVFSSVENTLKQYTEWNSKKLCDTVHCLDISGKKELNIAGLDISILGNVLWYDGSMKDIHDQIMENFANGAWLDAEILNFKNEWKTWNEKCVAQILEDSKTATGTYKILLTHAVPHVKLNLWSEKKSLFNAYSGMTSFLDEHKFDYAVCGHTHRRTVGQTINGCKCVNIGNDYNKPWEYFLLEI